MQVALDARRLQDSPLTGVGRWIAAVLPFLQRSADLTLLTDARRPSPATEGIEEVRIGVPGREPWWLQVGVARWLRHFDGVFHGTYNAVPAFGGNRSVVNIYDLSWEEHPEDLGRIQREAFRAQARNSIRRATAIITISDFIRDGVIERFGVEPDRVVLAPCAVDPVFGPERAADLPPLTERLGLPERYVVALGGAARRGAEVAIEAWSRLGPEKPGLVLVGAVPHVPRGVVGVRQLPDAEWASVLAGAEALCYPTRYEGFGMPALEAAASGTPIVCARVGPLPDVLGDAAEWCASTAVDDISAGLARVLGDDRRRAELRAAGLARAAAAPTWEQSAAAVLSAYEIALT